MSQPMPTSTYPPEKLLQLWRNEEMTETQRWPFRRGHLLQYQATLVAQVQALQKQVQSLQQAIKPLNQP